MIGFIGAAALIGLGMFAGRRHRWHGHHGHGFHHHGGFRRRGLRYVLERLGTTPGQEKAILSAIEDLKDRADDARDELRGTRKAVADALRQDRLEADAFAALFDGHVARLEVLRDEAAKAASTIHEALTPEQRDRLADLVESGRRFRGGRAFL